MRFVCLLLLFALAFSCQETITTESKTTAAPDRASAAADGSMALTPNAVTGETFFDFEDIIWGFNWLPDGHIVATVKDGRLLLIDPAGASTEIGGTPVVNDQSQGGLLDVLPHPDFATNRQLYFSYSKPIGKKTSHTAIARARLSDDNTALEDFTNLYVGAEANKNNHHYGSRLAWAPDGHLFFTIGDRGERDVNPQDTTRDAGKVYRIAADGSIPADNPFAGQEGLKGAIYSYGHRNPQGLVVHPETGELWETEHGPRGGDELNRIEVGKNYGWPVITYGINYSGSQITEEVAKAGMEQPVHYWVPSIAPSGTAFVTGNNYPGWEGDLLVGSLKFSYLQHVRMDGDDVIGEDILLKNTGRVRDVRMSPDDFIFASVEGIGLIRVVVK